MELRRPMILAVLAASAGCYTYRPIEMSELRTDMEVRARVSAAEADRLAEALPGEGRLVEGTVIEANGSMVTLLAPVTATEVRGQRQTLSQRLELPRSGILETELREFDRTRSVLFAAGITGAAVALAGAIFSDSGGDTSPGGPGGPPEMRIPFRIPIFGGR